MKCPRELANTWLCLSHDRNHVGRFAEHSCYSYSIIRRRECHRAYAQGARDASDSKQH